MNTCKKYLSTNIDNSEKSEINKEQEPVIENRPRNFFGSIKKPPTSEKSDENNPFKINKAFPMCVKRKYFPL
jgi:hypothetical protein